MVKVGDVVLIGPTHVRVTGIYLGGEGVENTIGLKSFRPTPSFANPASYETEMIVPERLVRLAGVYRLIEY